MARILSRYDLTARQVARARDVAFAIGVGGMFWVDLRFVGVTLIGRIARAELDRRERMEAESDPMDPAVARNRSFLEADRATVEGMLARLPASRIIERIGFEARRDEIREELARMDVES